MQEKSEADGAVVRFYQQMDMVVTFAPVIRTWAALERVANRG